jgi:hypothetical protein
VGVLIALAAQQMVESWSWRQKVAAAEQTMNEEIRNSLLAVAEINRLETCSTAQFEAMQDAILRGDRAKARQILVRGSAFGVGRLWADNAFEATIAAQVSDHLGAEKLKQYSQVYQMIRDIRRIKQDGEDVPPELAVMYFVPGLPISPDRRDALLREVASARLQMLAMRSSGEPLVRYAKKDLGLEVTQREYLAAPGRADNITQCEADAAAVKS